MEEQKTNLNEIIDQSERIGVVGSPSATAEIALDILGSAVNKKLIGELALFRYNQDGQTNYALGQITEIRLKNIWHEDPTMRSLIRQKGRIDAVSERQDTHLGDMTISAVFSSAGGTYRPSILGTVPPTGTPIHVVSDEILESILYPYRDQLFYLGKVYGSQPLLPLWFKHFDTGAAGAGEAYHLGIFGKTGSGKSVLAKMLLLAYARHKRMGLLVIDPQGEFAKELRGEDVPGGFKLPTKKILAELKKPTRVIGIQDLVLDRWDLFAQILFESPFFEKLSVPKGENRELAANIVSEQLKKSSTTLKDLHKKDAFEKAWKLLGEDKHQKLFYRTTSSRERFQSVYEESDPEEFYNDIWKPVTELFREDRPGAIKVEGLLFQLFDLSIPERPLIAIDLSLEQAERADLYWNQKIQFLIIRRLLDGIRFAAEKSYRENKSLNTLVMIDEAHRLASREVQDDDEQNTVRRILVDASRTTRKYGVGWVFISQTLSSLHREIIEQLRIFFFGFGLSMGTEFRALSELVGGRNKALDLYQLFRDPHSSFDVSGREYSFMTIGPVSPLSFAGTPLFFNAFNSVDDFLNSNFSK